jgi:hypothetical protein
LEGTCSDGKPSAQSNGNPTQLAYLPADRMTAFSRLSRFGMTFKPLTESRGEDLLMWFRAGFLVRTYPQPGKAKESAEPGRPCGNTWQELSMMYDRHTHMWKIHRSLFPGDLSPSLVTLPKWGMALNGVVYQRQTAVQTMREIESGYLLATPTATANQADPAMRKWRSCKNFQDAMLPTPTCHNAKEGDYPAERARNTPLLATHVGGKIHPHFTEWMMGWPQGWTDLKPLAMDRFLYAQQQRSGFSPNDGTMAPPVRSPHGQDESGDKGEGDA